MRICPVLPVRVKPAIEAAATVLRLDGSELRRRFRQRAATQKPGNARGSVA